MKVANVPNVPNVKKCNECNKCKDLTLFMWILFQVVTSDVPIFLVVSLLEVVVVLTFEVVFIFGIIFTLRSSSFCCWNVPHFSSIFILGVGVLLKWPPMSWKGLDSRFSYMSDLVKQLFHQKSLWWEERKKRKEKKRNKLGLSCAKLSSSWLQAYSASD